MYFEKKYVQHRVRYPMHHKSHWHWRCHGTIIAKDLCYLVLALVHESGSEGSCPDLFLAKCNCPQPLAEDEAHR